VVCGIAVWRSSCAHCPLGGSPAASRQQPLAAGAPGGGGGRAGARAGQDTPHPVAMRLRACTQHPAPRVPAVRTPFCVWFCCSICCGSGVAIVYCPAIANFVFVPRLGLGLGLGFGGMGHCCLIYYIHTQRSTERKCGVAPLWSRSLQPHSTPSAYSLQPAHWSTSHERWQMV
jgi:hypothetical protein